MNEKHDKTKGNINMGEMKPEKKIVYQICTELYNNQEKYKELEIYKEVLETKALKKVVCGVCVSHTDREYINMLSKQFETYFDLLLGTKEEVADCDAILGEEVMPMLDLKALGLQRSIELLDALYCLSFRKGDAGVEKRRYIQPLLKKVNVDKSIDLLNEVAEKLVGNDVQDLPGPEDYKKPVMSKEQKEAYEEEKAKFIATYLKDHPEEVDKFRIKIEEDKEDENSIQENKELIRKRNTVEILNRTYDLYYSIFKAYGFTKSLDELQRYLKQCLIEENPDAYMKGMEALYPQFGVLKKHYYVWLYIDLSCYCVLQYVVRKVQNGERFPYKLKEKIEDLAEDTQVEPIKTIHDIDKLLFQLISYYYRRDYFLQDIRTKKFIKENCESIELRYPEYSILEESKWEMDITDFERWVLWGSEDEKEKKKIKNKYKQEALKVKEIILEEKVVKDRTFQDNYDKIRANISEYCRATFRNLPSDMIHAKAFYRAVYFDTIPFGRRRTRQIFNDIISRKAVSKSEVYYLDERINMAICREKGNLQEFFEVSELQEKLYYLVCISLAQLEPENILNTFEGFFKPIQQIINED